MPRSPRVVIPGVPHHVTQRGNRRQIVFFSDADRLTYLASFKEQCAKFGLVLLAYCLMPNHVHHIVVPLCIDSLTLVFGTVHARYALKINERFEWSGHLWQCRFFSSVLDSNYFRNATRYVETNPVRAGIVTEAEKYQWSSARARVLEETDPYIDRENDWNRFIASGVDWKEFLMKQAQSTESAIRLSTMRNAPCGSEEFVKKIERETGQSFEVRPLGRPPKKVVNS